MPNEKKYLALPESYLDADTSPLGVNPPFPPNGWVNAENVRIGFTQAIESIGSNLLLSTPAPSVTYITIGSEADTVDNRVLKFNYNTIGSEHKIICLYPDTNIEYLVLLSSQVTGGLNFNKNYPIHSIRIVNGLCYFTDDLNQLRRFHIDAAIKMNNPLFVTDAIPYTAPIAPQVITVLRPPPLFPLIITKVNQTSPVLINNFIEDNAFQFSASYYYRNGELSKPSVYSLLAPYSSKTDDFNRIDVVFSISEYIEQDVQRVNILVKYGNENTFYVVKTWDKDIPSEAQEIINHNNGTALLTYPFYNDTVGEAQSESYSITPFDSVPINSESIEVFDNRLGAGNNLEGYDTPNSTSLNAWIVNQSEGGALTGVWVRVDFNDGAGNVHVIHYIEISDTRNFYSISNTFYPNTTVDYSNMTLVASGWSDFYSYLLSIYTFGVTFVGVEGIYIQITNPPSPVSLIGARCFKSGGFYKVSVNFFDFGDRKCGITGNTLISGVPMGQATLQIPDRSYSTITYVTNINWVLSNTSALAEIPLWADTYSVNITRCLLTRFFLVAQSKNALHSMTYVNRDTSNAYTFSTAAYTSLLTGVGVDITNLQNFGMGYVFSDGDIVNIYLQSDLTTVYRLKIIDQSGRWIVCELQDLGTLNDTTNALFQIYTPYIQSINEPYYEVAQKFAVTNAGTSGRQYSVLAGTIRGDVTLLDRGYLTENMSPNDKYYLNWYTDRGRPNFIDRIGQQRKETNISYSNVLIPGTRTNGLSSFDALDERNLPQECGAIQRLVLTSKVQDELGVVMLAICYNETASIYIGEVQLYGSNAPSTLAQAPNVIGTINVLKGSRGTRNPEAVIEYRGLVFFPDANNGKWVQYSLNGLDDISDYRTERIWKLWFEKYISLTPQEIEAFGCRPFIFTTIDPYNKELLISIPKLSNVPPRGYLPDYPNTIYPFDILDFQAKAVTYKLETAGRPPHWQSAFTFYAENFCTLQNKLYSFKSGLTYLHNQTNSTNNFYGVQYTSKIMPVSNLLPQVPKTVNNISVEANMKPSFVYFYIEYPFVQSSDLFDYDRNWGTKEGIFYATLYRNKLSTGTALGNLLTGEKMRGTIMFIMLEFSPTTEFLELRTIQIGTDISHGHTNQLTR